MRAVHAGEITEKRGKGCEMEVFLRSVFLLLILGVIFLFFNFYPSTMRKSQWLHIYMVIIYI